MSWENLKVLSIVFDEESLMKEFSDLSLLEQSVDFYKDLSQVKRVGNRKKEIDKILALIAECKSNATFLKELVDIIDDMSDSDKDDFDSALSLLKDNVDNTCVKPVADDNDGNATVVIGIAKTRIQNAVSSLQLF